MKSSLRWLGISTLWVSALLLAGCPDLGMQYSDKKETLVVNHYRQPCNANSTKLCFSVRKRGSKDDYKVFQNLSGFTGFKWGRRYTVDVETSFNNAGKPESYRYLSTLSSEADSTAFSLTLHSKSGILTSSTSDNLQWTIAGDKSFSVTAEQGADIKNAVLAEQAVQLEFTAKNDTLTLNKVKCRAAAADFAEKCEGVSKSRWKIAHFQSDCGLSIGKLCVIYRVDDSDDWELLTTDSTDIENFTPQWGKEYEIEVIKTVSDGGQLKSVKLADNGNNTSPEDRLDTTYSFVFILNGRFLTDINSNNQIAMYDGEQKLNCDSQCSPLKKAIDENHMILLKGYVQNDQVFVNTVICSANPGKAFDKDCFEDYNNNQGNSSKITWWRPSSS